MSVFQTVYLKRKQKREIAARSQTALLRKIPLRHDRLNLCPNEKEKNVAVSFKQDEIKQRITFPRRPFRDCIAPDQLRTRLRISACSLVYIR